MKHEIKFKRTHAGSYEVFANGQLVANIYGPDGETYGEFWYCYPTDEDLAVDLQFAAFTYREAKENIRHTAERHDGETLWHLGSEWKA